MKKMHLKFDANKLPLYRNHKFLLFIVASNIIAIVIVAISMWLYNTSGAAQLDLSRPGYKSVREQVIASENEFENFPSSGSLSKDIISDFKFSFGKHADKVKSVNAFGGDPLSPEELGIGPSAVTTN